MGIEHIIGENVSRFRKAAGMLQGELAAKAELTQMQISLIERGKKVTVDTLMKLATALEVPLYELLQDPKIENLDLKQKLEEIEKLPASKRKTLNAMIDVFLREHRQSMTKGK